jgi:hypothetical protein
LSRFEGGNGKGAFREFGKRQNVSGTRISTQRIVCGDKKKFSLVDWGPFRNYQ